MQSVARNERHDRGAAMPGGNECPVCGENIGIGAVFRAPLPDRIYCPHCRERLHYGDTGLLFAAAVVLFVALAGLSLGSAFWVGFDDPVLACAVPLGVLVLGGVAMEVAFVLILWYGSYRLEPVKPRSEWDEEEF
jgi:hypothetical protein